jgi:hypothetical protein
MAEQLPLERCSTSHAEQFGHSIRMTQARHSVSGAYRRVEEKQDLVAGCDRLLMAPTKAGDSQRPDSARPTRSISSTLGTPCGLRGGA